MDRKEMLKNVLESDKWNSFEIMGSLRVAISRCAIYAHKVWIWGCGENILPFVKTLEKEKIEIAGIVDVDPQKTGIKIRSLRVTHPDELFSQEKKEDIFVFIWTSCFEGNSQERMISKFNQGGITHWYKITAEDKKQVCYFTNHDHEQYYLENRNLIADIVDSLYDDKSVEDYLEYLRTYIENSSWEKEESATANKYFYGGTIDDPEQLYIHLDNEVWLNCGCHVGDTIFSFFRKGLKARKIFAVDGNKKHITLFRDSIDYLPAEDQKMISLKNAFIDKNIDFNTLFEGEKLTLINADIEGAELQLAKDMLKLIQIDRPVLALCLYHKVGDAVEIPGYLMENLENYCYVVRKYPSYYAFSYRNFELVLYAIPKERMAF